MPTLANPRHELFAQGLARGETQVEAFSKCGLTDSSKSQTGGHRLGKRPDIKLRVRELLTDVSMITKVDKAWIVSELQKTYERATTAEDYSACNKSLELLGKELGMFIDRHELKLQLERKVIIERLTEEQAAEMTRLVRLIEDGTDGV
jgi:hypothetical protein